MDEFIILSIHNVENIIFYNKQARSLLPEFDGLFKKWQFSVRTGLTYAAKVSVQEFVNSVTEDQLKKLEKYLNKKIIFNKIDSSIVDDYCFNIDNAEFSLNEMNIILGEISASRNADQIYLCFWR